MDSLGNQELLKKAKAGDPVALGLLLDRFRPYLRILAHRHLDTHVRTRVDPSDVVQQTCLEAYRDLERFRGEQEGELIAWLRQILHHNVAEVFQKHVFAQRRSVDRERGLEQSSGGGGGMQRLVASDQTTPSHRAMLDEKAVRLAAAMESLPPDQCEAVRLRHLEGLSLADMARRFERSEVAVAGLLKRGLRGLRERLVE